MNLYYILNDLKLNSSNLLAGTIVILKHKKISYILQTPILPFSSDNATHHNTTAYTKLSIITFKPQKLHKIMDIHAQAMIERYKTFMDHCCYKIVEGILVGAHVWKIIGYLSIHPN